MTSTTLLSEEADLALTTNFFNAKAKLAEGRLSILAITLDDSWFARSVVLFILNAEKKLPDERKRMAWESGTD